MTSRFTLLAVDVALTISATAFAVTMRENFDVSQAQPWSYLPFMCATAFSALALFAIAGLHRTVWRFSGFYDYVKVAATAVATSLAAIGLTFAYNRLEGVPRSLPFMQVLAAVAFLTSAR